MVYVNHYTQHAKKIWVNMQTFEVNECPITLIMFYEEIIAFCQLFITA